MQVVSVAVTSAQEGAGCFARDLKNPAVVYSKLFISVNSKRNARVGTCVPLM